MVFSEHNQCIKIIIITIPWDYNSQLSLNYESLDAEREHIINCIFLL